MSGPKCSEYSYDDTEYRRREEGRRREELRRADEAQRGIERVSAALARLRSHLSEAQIKFPEEAIAVTIPNVAAPTQMSYQALESHLSQLHAALARAEAEVSASIG